MKVFVAIDGDNIGQLVGRLSLAEDVAGLRRVSNAIAQGNEVWASWAQAGGGEVISDGGDEGRFIVESEKLGELEKIRARYKEVTGHPCSVGIGLKISEADKALLIAKLRGKDKKIFWEPEMGKELDEAQGEDSEEAKKITSHYLKKAVPDSGGVRKVYRVEDHKGRGPYTAMGDDVIDYGEPTREKKVLASRVANRSFVTAPKDQPTPQNPSEGVFAIGSTRRFGFSSPEKARQWFGDDTLKELGKHGFHLREVPALAVTHSDSGKQLVFLPHSSYKPGSGRIVRVVGEESAPGRLPLAPKDPARVKNKLQRSEPIPLQEGEALPTPVYALETDAGEFWHPKTHGHLLQKADDGGKQLEAVGTAGNNELVGHDPAARKISGQEHLAARFARAAGSPHSPGAGGGDEEAPTDQEQVSATKEDPDSGSDQQQVKQRIAEILTKVKGQAPMLEKMREQAPDLYEAVKGAVEAMLLMARETLPDEEAKDVAKAEFIEDDLSKACKCDAYKFPHREAGGKCKGSLKKEAKREADPAKPVTEGEELDKAGFQNKLNMEYPTGTTKDGIAPGNGNRDTGKVKVKPNKYNGGEPPKSGETKWRSVRAGVVMAPDGTPTSSLNPSGK